MDKRETGIDGRAGRITALSVLLVCITALLFIYRNTLFGSEEAGLASLNPELAQCLENRIGVVEKMRDEEVISEMQYDLFNNRARAYCETEFGEGDNPSRN